MRLLTGSKSASPFAPRNATDVSAGLPDTVVRNCPESGNSGDNANNPTELQLGLVGGRADSCLTINGSSSMPPVAEDDANEPLGADDLLPKANSLLVGEGVVIKGEVLVPDTLVVHGIVEGDDISVRNLIIGKTGLVQGNISVAANADILGEVHGKLSVRQILILRKSSAVQANVSYGMLQIEQGASLKGGIISNTVKPENKAMKVDELREKTRKSLQLDAPEFTRSANPSQAP